MFHIWTLVIKLKTDLQTSNGFFNREKNLFIIRYVFLNGQVV